MYCKCVQGYSKIPMTNRSCIIYALVPGCRHQHTAYNLTIASRVFAVRDLAPPGDLTSLQTFSFEFNDVEMQYDSYKGLQVRLRWAPCRTSMHHLYDKLVLESMLPLDECASSRLPWRVAHCILVILGIRCKSNCMQQGAIVKMHPHESCSHPSFMSHPLLMNCAGHARLHQHIATDWTMYCCTWSSSKGLAV